MNSQNPSIQSTHKHSRQEITFLDVTVYKNNDKLQVRTTSSQPINNCTSGTLHNTHPEPWKETVLQDDVSPQEQPSQNRLEITKFWGWLINWFRLSPLLNILHQLYCKVEMLINQSSHKCALNIWQLVMKKRVFEFDMQNTSFTWCSDLRIFICMFFWFKGI